MAILAELVDHVIGVDPGRDRVTAAVVCAKTQGEFEHRGLTRGQLSLRSTASRIKQLSNECRELEDAMVPIVREMCPALLAEPGVGTLIAAQILISWSYAGLCRDELAFARRLSTAPDQVDPRITPPVFSSTV